jgi:hypothetical protein
MKKPVLIGLGLIAAAIAYLYYKHRVAAIQQAQMNPNSSLSPVLGAMASGYERDTGQTGNSYTSNQHYTDYLSYMKQGGTNSGKSFNQFLTASQGNSLPSN